MKRITDLFEEIYDSELEGLDIQKQLCEEEELSREETERIFEKVCQKTEHFRTQKTRKFSKKWQPDCWQRHYCWLQLLQQLKNIFI